MTNPTSNSLVQCTPIRNVPIQNIPPLTLPLDTMIQILSNLAHKDIKDYVLVCWQSCNTVYEDRGFWQSLFLRAFPSAPTEGVVNFERQFRFYSNLKKERCSIRSLSALATDITSFVIHENRIVIGTFDNIELFNLTTLEPLGTLNEHRYAVLCFTICNEMVVSGSRDCTIKFWNLPSKKSTLTLTNDYPLYRLASDGKRLLSADTYHRVKSWDLESQTSKTLFKGLREISALAVKDDVAFVGHDGNISRLDLTEKEKTITVKAHLGVIHSLVFYNKMVVSSGPEGIKNWNPQTLNAQSVIVLTDSKLEMYSYVNPWNEKLISIFWSLVPNNRVAKVKLWDLDGHQLLEQPTPQDCSPNINSPVAAHDGKLILQVSSRDIRIYDYTI
jgi:WD40 repeat protein